MYVFLIHMKIRVSLVLHLMRPGEGLACGLRGQHSSAAFYISTNRRISLWTVDNIVLLLPPPPWMRSSDYNIFPIKYLIPVISCLVD